MPDTPLKAIASAHNWARGNVAQARGAMTRVLALDTATVEAKALAGKIEQDLTSLLIMLEKRTDQQ